MTKNKEEAESQIVCAKERLEAIVAQASVDFITDVVTNDGLETCKVISQIAKSFVNIFNAIDCEIKVAQELQRELESKQEANQEDPSLN